MHTLVIYFLSGLFPYSRSREAPAILEVQVLPRTNRRIAPLELPKVDLQRAPPLEITPPEFVPEMPAEQASIAVETLPDDPIPPELKAAAPPEDLAISGKLIGPRPIAGPHTSDLYPPKSFAAREHGRVAMILCISPSGKVDDVKLAASSGFPRLDAAGLSIAAQYRFKPATRNGIPVPVCVRYQLNFRIDI